MPLLAPPPPPPPAAIAPATPPIVALGSSRIQEIRYQVTVTGFSGNQWSPDTLSIPPSDLGLSLVMEGPSSRVDRSSLSAAVWLNSRPVPDLQSRCRLAPGIATGNELAIAPLPAFTGESIRWQTSFLVECFDVATDEARAASITWPRDWPEEVERFRRPEPLIESDAPPVRAFVERTSGGRLREVPPYLAAKDLVRAAVVGVRNLTGTGVVREGFAAINGIEVNGCLPLLSTGDGTPADLVCLAVAALRAAGIPARPVLGVTRYDDPKRKMLLSKGNGPWVWGEFWLPEAGWIPFDPVVMRRQSLRTLDVRAPWKGFASPAGMKELVPMAWTFMPTPPFVVNGWPAMWWSTVEGLVFGPTGSPVGWSNASISVTMIGRGRGTAP
jgi:hypothetical protein